MGCLECKVFFCENSGAWKFEVTRKARLDHVHGYWNRVRQSYNSTILVKLASVRCLRHNSRYSTQRIGHRSQSCLEGQIDISDVRHVQIFPVPYRPFIRALASLRYLIDYLDHVRPGYQVVGFERVVMEVGDVKILGQEDLIFPRSLEDTYRIDMNPPSPV